MKELTKAEYDSHKIARMPPNGMFIEKRWYSYKDMLGVIIFDHDNEWAIVVLAQDDKNMYRAVDTNVGFKTQDIAIEQLRNLFEECESEPKPCGPPLTELEAAAIVSAKTGVPLDQVIIGMEQVKIPLPRNN